MNTPNILEQEYTKALDPNCGTWPDGTMIMSDINEHLPSLRALADQCETVTEFGVRSGASTRAFLASNCKLKSYDLFIHPTVSQLFDTAKQLGKDCSYTAANTLELTIEPTDLLFIDTYHIYDQLIQELNRHYDKVKKYIAFHDTYTFGLVGENQETKGLLTAIIEFMTAHPEWKFKHHAVNNNGLTIIERVTVDTHPIPVVEGHKKRILLAIPTAKNIEVETFKSIFDLEVPNGYSLEFQYFYGYNIDQVRNLIAHWAINYDYLFSVDSDIAFERDTLKKLLAHNCDVVSGLYIQRKFGHHILEIYEHNGHGGVTNVSYEKIKGRGLVEIAGCGFGCTLVKSEVLRAIGYPQFEYHSAIDHANTISEDTDFCRKALSKGFRIWADTSIQCRHIGSYTFTIDNNIPAQHTTITTVEDRLRSLSNKRLMPTVHVEYLARIRDEYGFIPNVAYDIGACVLHWTDAAKTVWPNTEYIAFDAMDAAEFLYKEHGMKYNIGVLSDYDGKEVDFYQNNENPGGNSYYRENSELSSGADVLYTEAHRRKLKAVTLDAVVVGKRFPLPDLIKMDVQGAELDVLKGAQGTLKTAKHVILELQSVEYNKGAPLKDDIIAFMNQIGFECKGIFCNNGPDGDYHFVRR